MSKIYKITYIHSETNETAECIYLFRSITEAEHYAQKHVPIDASFTVSVHSTY